MDFVQITIEHRVLLYNMYTVDDRRSDVCTEYNNNNKGI